MTDMNGYEPARMLKADSALRPIPLVAVTAPERPRAQALGAAGYLTRPIDPEALLAEVEAWLSG